MEKLGVVYDDGSLQSEHREGTSPYRDYHVDLTEGENLHVIVDNYWPMSATLELIAPNDNGDLSDPDTLKDSIIFTEGPLSDTPYNPYKYTRDSRISHRMILRLMLTILTRMATRSGTIQRK